MTRSTCHTHTHCIQLTDVKQHFRIKLRNVAQHLSHTDTHLIAHLPGYSINNMLENMKQMSTAQ